MTYTIDDVCMVGARINNTKRNYLLADPLQGKHIPVSPKKTYELCTSLGEKLKSAAEDAVLIVGFAETATAVGAIAAMCFSDVVVYVHTTRENIVSSDITEFREEHSHAVEQKIDSRYFLNIKKGTVIMIDDEISTGNTVVNMIAELRGKYPDLSNVRFVIGSVINRMTEERLNALKSENIEFVSLVKSLDDTYTEKAAAMTVSEPKEAVSFGEYKEILSPISIPDLKKGMPVGKMKEEMQKFSESVLSAIENAADTSRNMAFIGTEECMTAAIMAGMLAENKYGAEIYTHSTTRSPIGICDKEGYPCRNGIHIPSFYEDGRNTFIYNLQKYDIVVVITDSKNDAQMHSAMKVLSGAFACNNTFLVKSC